MKKIIISLIAFTFLFIPNVNAEDKIDIYLFYGDGCTHCAHEEEYLEDLQKENKDIEVHLYETWYNEENQILSTRVKNALGIENSGVPFTVIGNTGMVGFGTNTKYQIENLIKHYDDDISIVEKVIKNPTKYDKLHNPDELENHFIKLPILGEIDAKHFSLPIISIVIGVVDGFNPCAMWILLFLISMLLGMKNRKRMWILGLTFLITSSLTYLLFMISWLNLAKLITDTVLIRNIIAVVALVAGAINLASYFEKEDGCDIVNKKERKKIFKKIKKFTREKHLLPAVLGIMALAVTVNIVELACSAGLPLLFTQILAMNDLTSLEYLAYMLIYIFFFLLDDIIVFTVAMVTLKVTGITTKYSNYSHLIGGIIMIIIGILLIFAPNILMFNF